MPYWHEGCSLRHIPLESNVDSNQMCCILRSSTIATETIHANDRQSIFSGTKRKQAIACLSLQDLSARMAGQIQSATVQSNSRSRQGLRSDQSGLTSGARRTARLDEPRRCTVCLCLPAPLADQRFWSVGVSVATSAQRGAGGQPGNLSRHVAASRLFQMTEPLINPRSGQQPFQDAPPALVETV